MTVRKILTVLRGLMASGIAACNIGGVTLHSFAGVGLAHEKPEQLVKKVRLNKKAMGRWLRTKVLIIDEGESPRPNRSFKPVVTSFG